MNEPLTRDSRLFPGTKSYLHWWKAGTGAPPQGYVIVAHGIGEHGARYIDLARFLNSKGFDVLAPDHPGHGLSAKQGGQKTLVTVGDMSRELEAWIDHAKSMDSSAASAPWYALGHSMGALILLHALTRTRRESVAGIRKAWLSAPPLRLRMPVPAWKELLSKLLLEALPNLKIPSGIDPNFLSFDRANVEAYRKDPLVHPYASPRIYRSITEAAEHVMKHPEEARIPTCLTVGEQDPIVVPASVEEYCAALSVPKKFIKFPESKHEILNDRERLKCYETVSDWFLS